MAGPEFDTVSYSLWDNYGRTTIIVPGINGSAPNGVTVNLQTSAASDSEGGSDTLSRIENVVGSSGHDTISGDGTDNRIEGAGGNDTLAGGGGSGDVAVYSGNRSDYNITDNGDGTITIAHTGGTQLDGIDTVQSFELFQFADGIKTQAELFATGNSAPSGLTLSANVVAENSAVGTVVGLKEAAPSIRTQPVRSSPI